MYPNLYYFFKDVFGISFPFFKVINMFGLFMVISFFVSAWLLAKELKRKQKAGYFTNTQEEITVGEAPTIAGILPPFLWGCIVGYKFIGLMFTDGALNDSSAYLLSPSGSIIGALVLGIAFAVRKWVEIDKQKLPRPEKKIVQISAAERITTIAIIAAVAGLVGAKLFHNLENWGSFIKDPIGSFFSPSGLTFYGGLITATLALWYYAHKIKMRFINLCDAAAPVLMMAYCIGRMGCQVAGDGDWGIINSAYLTNIDGTVNTSDKGKLDTAFAMYGSMYMDVKDENIPHKSIKALAGLPVWMFAQSYPHNTLRAGIPTMFCKFDDYCNHLPLPVFPTPLYEVVLAFILFAILWALRKRIKMPGRLFAVYLIMNGVERFFVEQIRVNTKYSILGLHPSQAEIISVMLVAGGIFLWWYAPKMKGGKQPAVTTPV